MNIRTVGHREEERNILATRIRLEAKVTEREGMIAENKQREHRGGSMAYTEEDFVIVAREMSYLLTQVI